MKRVIKWNDKNGMIKSEMIKKIVNLKEGKKREKEHRVSGTNKKHFIRP